MASSWEGRTPRHMQPRRGEYVQQLAVQILGKRNCQGAAAAPPKKARVQARTVVADDGDTGALNDGRLSPTFAE
jgi:hypothetical protein